MIVRLGEHIFHEHNVAIHFERRNVFCPWRIIGFYATYNKFAQCMYIQDYKWMEAEFHRETCYAGHVRGTYEFLDQWHQRHQEPNSVISKVIRYRTVSNDSYGVLKRLYGDFAGRCRGKSFGQVVTMLRSKDGFYPQMYQGTTRRAKSVLKTLLKAKAI